MKRHLLLSVPLLLFACRSEETVAPIDVPAPENLVAEKLLEGHLTDHWRGYRQEGVPDGWTLADGVLTTSGAAGDLITVDTYDDFVLELEWKVGPGGNSGIFYRANESTDQIYMNSAEMQILDNAGAGVEATSTNAAGSNYALHAPPKDLSRPAGEWNHARIEAFGPKVRHYLNGEFVCGYEFYSPEWEALVKASKFGAWKEYGRATRGHIGLQGHGDPVEFRNIRIERLPVAGR